jgi:hypothetical protein
LEGAILKIYLATDVVDAGVVIVAGAVVVGGLEVVGAGAEVVAAWVVGAGAWVVGAVVVAGAGVWLQETMVMISERITRRLINTMNLLIALTSSFSPILIFKSHEDEFK